MRIVSPEPSRCHSLGKLSSKVQKFYVCVISYLFRILFYFICTIVTERIFFLLLCN